MTDKNKLKIGVALGSGSARGWAHIGALKQLTEMGIRPEIIAGCSIGSLVGAAYAVDNLHKLEQWALSLTRLEMMRYFELNTSFKGFVHQERLRNFLHEHVCAEKQSIEGLKHKFASVATDIHTGRELWLNHGSVIDAVWASISIPGLFPPVAHQNRWLVDGGLVNPVPVSLCRAMGADIVIAVNLNGSVLRARSKKQLPESEQPETPATESPDNTSIVAQAFDSNTLVKNVAASLREYSSTLFPQSTDDNPMPGLMDALMGSIYIMQDKITRSRMAGDPPEILLSPRVGDVGLLEFHRADEAIEEGRQSVLRMQSEIEHIMEEFV